MTAWLKHSQPRHQTIAIALVLATSMACFFSMSAALILLFAACGFGLLAWFAERDINSLFALPLTFFIFALGILYLIGASYSAGTWHSIVKEIKPHIWLLTLPLIMTLPISTSQQKLALNSFMVIMTGILLLSTLKHYNIVSVRPYSDSSAFIRTHIQQGFFSVIYIGIALYRFKAQPKNRLVYAALVMLACFVIFNISLGRTGFILLPFVIGFFALRECSIKLFSLLLLSLISIFAMSYWGSANFKTHVNHSLHNIKIYNQNPRTSIGYRLKMFENTLAFTQQKPFFGSGTGSILKLYAALPQSSKAVTYNIPRLEQEIANIAVQFGALGLIIFAFIFLSFIKASKAQKDPELAYFSQLLVLVYFISCCYFTAFTDVTEYTFLAAWLAILFAAPIPKALDVPCSAP